MEKTIVPTCGWAASSVEVLRTLQLQGGVGAEFKDGQKQRSSLQRLRDAELDEQLHFSPHPKE